MSGRSLSERGQANGENGGRGEVGQLRLSQVHTKPDECQPPHDGVGGHGHALQAIDHQPEARRSLVRSVDHLAFSGYGCHRFSRQGLSERVNELTGFIVLGWKSWGKLSTDSGIGLSGFRPNQMGAIPSDGWLSVQSVPKIR